MNGRAIVTEFSSALWLSRARPAPGETARDLALADTRQYFTLVMKEVNARFRTLEEYNNFRLTVRPVGFVIAEKHAYFHSEDSLPSLAPLRIPLGSKLVKDGIVRDLVFESTETI
nr:hypothetical protein BaRGS_006358 [Batillaria attramentaria]